MNSFLQNFSHGSIRWGFAIEAKGKTAPLFTQVHGNHLIEIIDPSVHRQTLAAADGGFSFKSGVEISVFTADCFPLLFFTDQKIAAVHAGWRGSLAGIAREATHRLGLKGGDYHLVMGPALLDCCFEVKEDFVDSFKSKGRNIDAYLESREAKLYFHHDRFVIEEELKEIPPRAIHAEMRICTFCSSTTLPSYRRNKGTDPRIRSWIVRD